MSIVSRFKSLPKNSRLLLSLGGVLAIFVALPLFVWGVVTQTYNIVNKAQTISTNGPTNACGGTCGSIYNCDTNLFCFQGYCRNPDCPNDSTCGCVTPSPTATSKTTPKATVKPTPRVETAVSTPTATASATPASVVTASPSAAPIIITQNPKGPDIKTISLWIGLGTVALIVILVAVNALKKDNQPPIVNPPLTGVNPPPAQNPPMQENPPSQYPPSVT